MSVTDKVREYSTKYTVRKVPPERGVLYLEFPLHAYWRDASTIPELKIKNVEGLIHPSFTIVTFTEGYRVEQVDQKSFVVHKASGYTPCPLCGRVIRAEVENTEIEVSKPIERFYPEVAYELAVSTIAKETSKKVKSHIMYTHNHKFEVVGKDKVTIMRNVGPEEIVIETEITSYMCKNDGKRVTGVLGILDHVVSEHEMTDTTKEVVALVERVTETAKKLANLGKENIPILGAFRNTFSYVLVPETGKPKNFFRVLKLEYFSSWLLLKVVERDGRVDLVATTMMPRPLRGIFHHPVFRYGVLEMAYKMNPNKYNWFIVETKRALQRNGYRVDRLAQIDSMITGALAYTPIEPKHAFGVSIDVLESVRRKIEEKAIDLRVFLSHRVV